MLSDKLLRMRDSLESHFSTIDCIEDVSYKNDVLESFEITRLIFFEMLVLITKGMAIVKYSSTMTIIKIYDMKNNYLYHYKHSLKGDVLEVTTLLPGSTQGVEIMSGFLPLVKTVNKQFLRFARLNTKENNTLSKKPDVVKVDIFSNLRKHLKREVRTRKIDGLLQKGDSSED